jgi:hypothetical protein
LAEKKNMVKAWKYDDENTNISLDELKKIGVLYFQIDSDNYEKDGSLENICKERGKTLIFQT